MKLSICNKELDQILFSNQKKIVFYGEAATGKTNLLLSIVKCSMDLLGPFEGLFYVSTEGSTFVERALRLRLERENIFFSVAIDQHHLLMLILDIVRTFELVRPIAILIDSINSHYRVESALPKGAVVFAELLALLDALNKNNIHVIASAQVRFGDEEVPGYEYLNHWADIIIKLSRGDAVYRTIRFLKPNVGRSFCFDIVPSGIKWIRCPTTLQSLR